MTSLFFCQDSGVPGSSHQSRALLLEALCKHREKKETWKTKSHNKPLGICIDVIAEVKTLIVLSDFVKIKLLLVQKKAFLQGQQSLKVLGMNSLGKISGSS